MTTTIKNEIPDSQAIKFLQELKVELPYSSTRKTVSLVRTILSKLKSASSAQPISSISHETSPVLHLLSVCHHNGEVSQDIVHLDELIDNLYHEDQHKEEGKQLFRTEVDALNIITRVLSKIEVLFSNTGINPFTQTLTYELQQATQEG